jgi:hypothetical protein
VVPGSQVKKEIENVAGDSRLPSPCPSAQGPGDGPGLTAELCAMTTFSITRLKFTVVLAGGGSSASLNRLSESRESHILAATYPIGASPFDLPRTAELLDQAYRSTLRSIDADSMNRPNKRTPTAPRCSATSMPGAAAPLAAYRSVQPIIASQRAFWHSG